MKTRGRTSAASMAISTVGNLETIPRPDAPYDLTDEQTTEWWAIVNRMPADWFPRETHGMLSQYCRHVVSARRVAQLIEQMMAAPAFDVNDYNQLLIMQEREGRAMTSLATKMRISQQTQYDKSKKHGKIGYKKPWEE